MTGLPDFIDLGPEEEAERLWRGALQVRHDAADNLVSLCEFLDLGLRTVEILAIQRLQPIKDQFPATIGVRLEMPTPEVDVQRDAISVPNSLRFTDIVDLLSGAELECVSPGMHRGWEDRRFACRRSRTTAQQAIGVTLEADTRDHLLLLAAYHNRIFRYPPPVRVDKAAVLAALEAVVPLVDSLRANP